MTTASITYYPTSRATAQTPFCDKYFRTLGVLAAAVSDLCIAIICKIASYFAWIFSKKISYFVNSVADYHLLRLNHAQALFRYGKRVIDFSLNFSWKASLVHQKHGIDALKQAFGNKAIERWANIGTAEIPLDHTKLALSDKGQCAGVSLDFISHYLEKIRSGKTPLEAMKLVAPLYAEGATDEAAIAQSFYHALDRSKLVDNYRKNICPDLKAQRDRGIEKWLSEEENKITEKTKEGIDAAFDKILIQSEGKKAELQKQFNTVKASELANIQFQKAKLCAEKMGFPLERGPAFAVENTKDAKFDLGFQQLVNELPENIYQVGMGSSTAGHSIVVIKTADSYFIHDSNFAALVSSKEEAAHILWDIAKTYYWSKEGFGYFSFNPATQSAMP